MPPRLVCLALLLYWSAAVTGLVTRDLLPELSLANPPDFRAIARAGQGDGPTRWTVHVLGDSVFPENLRPVGEAVTDSNRRPDGSVQLTSHLRVNAKGLLKNTPFETPMDIDLEIASTYDVDPSGNLRTLHAGVKFEGDPDDQLTVDGRIKNRAIELTTSGPLPMFSRKLSFPYEPRSLVQNPLGAVDRLPGLHLGQRWTTRVVNPITSRSDVVRAQVTRRTIIHWGKNPVTVFEVVHHLTPVSVKTWVRTDGLVLRQEVPFPFVKLVLERQPDRVAAGEPR
jgi:hypothetical protein